MKVRTESNNGTALSLTGKKMTNQCMYLSLSYALQTDVNEIRKIGDLSYRTYHSMFDEDKKVHKEALKKITDYYQIKVIIYSCCEDNSTEIIIHPNFIINDKPVPRYIEGCNNDKVIKIAHYDEHFEYIHEILCNTQFE